MPNLECLHRMVLPVLTVLMTIAAAMVSSAANRSLSTALSFVQQSCHCARGMLHTTVLPVLTMLRPAHITMSAALEKCG